MRGPFAFSLEHLRGAEAIDPRGMAAATTLGDNNLGLKYFLPAKLIAGSSVAAAPTNLREVQRSYFIWTSLTRRARPWDLSHETITDFLVQHDWFCATDKSVLGYIRNSAEPVVGTLTLFIEQAMQLSASRAAMGGGLISRDSLETLFREHAVDNTKWWSERAWDTHAQPKNSHAKPSKGKKTADGDRAKVFSRVKTEIGSRDICIYFNAGVACTRKLDPNTNTCSFTKGTRKTALAHKCAVCSGPHSMIGAH